MYRIITGLRKGLVAFNSYIRAVKPTTTLFMVCDKSWRLAGINKVNEESVSEERDSFRYATMLLKIKNLRHAIATFNAKRKCIRFHF